MNEHLLNRSFTPSGIRSAESMMDSISHVEVFFEPNCSGVVGSALAGGSTVQHGPNRVNRVVAEADKSLGLNGELLRFCSSTMFKVENLSPMDEAAWRKFLNGRGRGTNWERWHAGVRDGRWNVIIWRNHAILRAPQIETPPMPTVPNGIINTAASVRVSDGNSSASAWQVIFASHVSDPRRRRAIRVTIVAVLLALAFALYNVRVNVANAPPGNQLVASGLVASFAALALFMFSCARIAKLKGRTPWWGILGVFSVLGIAVTLCLRDRRNIVGSAESTMDSISHVEIYFEPSDGGAVGAALRGGSIVQHGPNRVNRVIAEADKSLGLNGELLRFCSNTAVKVENSPRMEADGWRSLLDARGRGTNWERWHANVKDGRWNVVIWRAAEKPQLPSATPPPSSDTKPAEGQLYPVLWHDKFGYVNATGEFVIPPQFDHADFFSDGLAIVGKRIQEGGRDVLSYGYINTQGKTVVDYKFWYARAFAGGRACVATRMFNVTQYGYIDRLGKYLIKPRFRGAGSYADGVAPAAIQRWLGLIESGFGYIDAKGNIAAELKLACAEPFSEGFAAVGTELKGKRYQQQWGYIDRRFNQRIPQQYEEAGPFSEGLACVRKAGKFGFINTSGQMVVEPVYERAGKFSEGLAPVAVESSHRHFGTLHSFGYINRQGTFVIAPQFDGAEPFTNGLARVGFRTYKYDVFDYALIDRGGAIRWSPSRGVVRDAGFYTSPGDNNLAVSMRGMQTMQLLSEAGSSWDPLSNVVRMTAINKALNKFPDHVIQQADVALNLGGGLRSLIHGKDVEGDFLGAMSPQSWQEWEASLPQRFRFGEIKIYRAAAPDRVYTLVALVR